MKVLIAIDSMKGSLSSIEGGKAIAAGVHRVFPDASCDVRPLADGGEGTLEALVAGLGGERREIEVTGPAGKPVEAAYGIIGNTAVVEMARAAGITLVSGAEKNPSLTTTYGVGEIIADAIANGARKFIVGIGGGDDTRRRDRGRFASARQFLSRYGRQCFYGRQGTSEAHSVRSCGRPCGNRRLVCMCVAALALDDRIQSIVSEEVGN